MIVAGFDPGKGGAGVILYPDNSATVLRVPIIRKPKETPAWSEWARIWCMALDLAAPDMIVIEQVGAMPTQGVTSMFNFGRTLGFLEGLINSCTNAPLHRITPSVWKSKFGLLKADKNASREKVRELLPNLASEVTRVKDDGVAEAALLAYYGRKFL